MVMTASEYLAQLRSGIDPFATALDNETEKCTKCEVTLQEAITGYRKIGDAPYCSDDYFEVLGEMVEAHPVGLPRSSLGH
jgi:hypothetical protein